MKIITLALILLLVAVPILGASIDGGTIFVVDASGSGSGQGVSTATDNDALREKSVRELLGRYQSAKSQLPVAIITCGEEPKVLLEPTTDGAAISSFIKNFRLPSAGGTPISGAIELLRGVPGRSKHVVYVGDGLLTDGRSPSTEVVKQLATELTRLYGTRPFLHMIAVDSSGVVFTRTKPSWMTITEGSVAEVRDSTQIIAAADKTASNLQWTRPDVPSASPAKPSGAWRSIGIFLIGLGLLATALNIIKNKRRSAPNALITIEENGQTRRASARLFGKPEVSIGDGASDIKVPAWEKPITVLQREVVDRRGRKRRQTIAQYGNRSVVLGRIPVSFSNGTTTVKVRGGRT